MKSDTGHNSLWLYRSSTLDMPQIGYLAQSLASAKSHCLSGKPRLTPNAGYTKRVMPFFLWMPSSASISEESSLTVLRLSSIREGVTDFGRAHWPLLTAPEVNTVNE